jgi:tetratricopeptide (TPR) repeat protein
VISRDADLEIGLRWRNGAFDVYLEYDDSEDVGDRRQYGDNPVVIDVAALAQFVADDQAYGENLSRMLFGADRKITIFYNMAKAVADSRNIPLHFRLFVDPAAPVEYHLVRWESLRDPDDGSVIATKRNFLMSRYLSHSGWRPLALPQRHDLRALVAIANPSNLSAYAPKGVPLTNISVADELARAQDALAGIQVTKLVSPGEASLEMISDALDAGIDILYLVCHGALVKGQPRLYLERPDGTARLAAGSELAKRVSELERRPTLAVLCSCYSAGAGDEGTASDEGALAPLGPSLAAAGVAAVVAMQGNVTRKTANAFLTAFFGALRKDGIVDRAVAIARGAVSDRSDWWMPVLFSRLTKGRTYYIPDVDRHRAMSLPSVAPISSRRARDLVEREAEVGALAAALERAAGGCASVVMVAGEAGIGKTTLVRDVEERARSSGMVLRGDCFQLDGGELPYAPLAAALRGVPATRLSCALERLTHAGRAELARAFPQLHAATDPPGSVPADDARRRLYESLLCLLAELTAQAPVLFIIEDLHWVDRSTADFVRFLAHALRTERIVCLITYRTSWLPRRHALHRMVRELERLDAVEAIELRPLSRSGSVAQISQILPEPPPPHLVDKLYQRSGGNPYFLEQLLAAQLDGRAGELPPTIKEAELSRFDRVSEPTLYVLRFAAALGRPAETEFLATVSGLDDIELSAALHEAIEHQLLAGDAGGTFRFCHELAREALYGELLPGERATLHATVAHALASKASVGHAELAFHWRAAGSDREALVSSVEAGLQAERARAFADAAHHFQVADEIWARAGAPSREPPLDRINLLLHLCDAAKHAGDYKLGMAVARRGIAEVDSMADPVSAAEFYARLGGLLSSRSADALGCYQRALRLMPADRRVRRARLLAQAAFALWGLDRYPEARRSSEEALALASEAHSDAEIAYARMVLGFVLASDGDVERGERHLRDALRIAPEEARPDDLLYAHIYLGEVLRLRGRFDEARSVMRDGANLARELGMERGFGWFLTLNAAMDLFHLGRWREAEQLLAGVPDRQEDWCTVVLRQVAGQVRLGRGDLEGAAAQLADAQELCKASAECVPAVYAALAELALWEGRHEEARAHVWTGLRMVSGKSDPLYVPALHSIGARAEADAADQARDDAVPVERSRATAERCLTSLERLLAEWPRGHRPPTAVAHLATCRAEIARLERTRAVEHWDTAVRAWDMARAPYPATYARWRHAGAILAAGDARADAARVLFRAHDASRRLGARLLRENVEQLAHSANIALRHRSPRGAIRDEWVEGRQ